MPVYEYRCTHSDCSHIETVVCAIDDEETRRPYDEGTVGHGHRCLHDGNVDWWPFRRVFSFSSPADPIGDGYYDNSSGLWVTSKRQLDDHNKAVSEAHTARTGVETRFVSHDIRDVASTLKPDPD